jgi:hypothetical protein
MHLYPKKEIMDTGEMQCIHVSFEFNLISINLI